MTAERPGYVNPLVRRYASAEMSELFSEERRLRYWRRCWVALAESQQELGLPIRSEQLEELKERQEDLNLEVMRERERELRHDVMAAVHAYAALCPKAAGILHWGATSCDITDNGDLLQYHEALLLIRRRLLAVLDALARFAERHKAARCLGYTHLQPAQPTTLGKRACLWLQDAQMVYEELERFLKSYRLRGLKGATGTQDSFLKLFEGDHSRVKELEARFCRKLGFPRSFPVTGQTYPRLVDSRIMDLLSGLAQAGHKLATDLRLMQHLKILEEPFEEKQVGSSSMAYKRNPMRCERLCSLARFLLCLSPAAGQTAALQWLERTLDDSAGRRLYLPQAFLAAEALLLLARDIVEGLRVFPRVIKRQLEAELPFLATEAILLEGVRKGADRQVLHEAIREAAFQASQEIKEGGGDNRLFELLSKDPRVPFDLDQLQRIASSLDFSGRAEKQVEEYLAEEVRPILKRDRSLLAAEEGGEPAVRV